MNKTFKILLIAAAVAGAGYFAWVRFSRPARPAASAVSAEARAERRDIQETVDASGFVRAVVFSSIRAQVSSPILKLHVQTGDMVKKDQVLAVLDPVLYNADEAEARRGVQLQTLTLERLERDLRRVEVLVKKGFVSEREVLDHRTAFEVAKLQRDIAQARLDKAEENVRRTVIRAPHDGQVSDCTVVEGQIVIGAQSINNGTLLMTVSDTSMLRVDVNLNEFAATRVSLGREATVTFDSIPNLRKKGEISFMTPFGTADLKVPDLRVFPTQVSFPAGDGVRPGISANVSVLVAREKGCVAVPVSAVFIEGPDRVIYVKGEDGSWERRVVKLGLSDASWTQVREGLAVGDTVSLVRPAAPVR